MLTVARCNSLKREESLLLDIAKFLFFYGHFHSLKKKKKLPEVCVLRYSIPIHFVDLLAILKSESKWNDILFMFLI